MSADVRAALAAARRVNDYFRERNAGLKRDLAAVQAELEGQRAAAVGNSGHGWYVARSGGRTCARCDGPIERGHAVEIMPGIDADVHVFCPDRSA